MGVHGRLLRRQHQCLVNTRLVGYSVSSVKVALSPLALKNKMKLFSCCILVVVSLACSSPVPQSNEQNSINIDTLDDNYEDNYGDYEGTYDVTENRSDEGDPNLGNIINSFGQIAQGFLALLDAKAKLIHSVLGNKKAQERIGGAVSVGVNVTRAAGPIVAGALSQIPKVLAGSGRLVDSIIKAANETAPLLKETLEEYGNQAPLITGIARSYAEINIENARQVLKAFGDSLNCNRECQDMEGDQLEQCKQQFCKHN